VFVPRLRVSVIIPCLNSVAELTECLAALGRVNHPGAEYIVVDDGSDEDLMAAVRSSGLPVRLIAMGTRCGSAAARNRGSGEASGDILLFLDADVRVQADTLARIEKAFEDDPGLAAVMGSYDDNPSAPGFHSQFRNLLHCYVHRTGRRRACTFWTGCGAIRRDVFQQHGGFKEHLGGMDDIELGGRLAHSGARIELRPDIQVQHLKRWTFRSWARTDFLLRGIPWTLVLLRGRSMPDALNVNYRNRASVALAALSSLACMVGFARPDAFLAALVLLGLGLWLNRGLYAFLRERRGWGFAAAGAGAHFIHLLICGLSFVSGAAYFALSRRERRSYPTGFERVRVLEKAAD